MMNFQVMLLLIIFYFGSLHGLDTLDTLNKLDGLDDLDEYDDEVEDKLYSLDDLDELVGLKKDLQLQNSQYSNSISFSSENKISSYDTYCSTTSSCQSTTVTDSFIGCYGYHACAYSTITVSSWCNLGGLWAGHQATISSSSDSGYIYCLGRISCYQGSVTTTYGNIWCDGSASCRSSTLETQGNIFITGGNYAGGSSNLTANITYCRGFYSCYGSNIIGENGLYVTGESALTNSYIYDTPYIYDIGSNSFNGATISSNGISNLDIISWGYRSTSDSTILCYSGSTCFVRCRGVDTCDSMTIYCEDGATCRTVCRSCSNCPTVTNVDSIDNDVLLKGLVKINDKINFDDNDNDIEEISLNLNKEYIDVIDNSKSNNIFHFFNTKPILFILINIVIGIVIYKIIEVFICNCKSCFNNNSKNKQFQYQQIV